MNRSRLRTLAALAAMKRERELADLAARQSLRHALETKLRQAREHRAQVVVSAAPDPAHLAGADACWLRLNARQMEALSYSAADAAARAETQKLLARRAFGQAEVLARLAERRD